MIFKWPPHLKAKLSSKIIPLALVVGFALVVVFFSTFRADLGQSQIVTTVGYLLSCAILAGTVTICRSRFSQVKSSRTKLFLFSYLYFSLLLLLSSTNQLRLSTFVYANLLLVLFLLYKKLRSS
jgi:drug/metabolite transporter (DMT)-like permease